MRAHAECNAMWRLINGDCTQDDTCMPGSCSLQLLFILLFHCKQRRRAFAGNLVHRSAEVVTKVCEGNSVVQYNHVPRGPSLDYSNAKLTFLLIVWTCSAIGEG